MLKVLACMINLIANSVDVERVRSVVYFS